MNKRKAIADGVENQYETGTRKPWKADFKCTSTCQDGQEQYRKFCSGRNSGDPTTMLQYDYRSTQGLLFSCVGKSLSICRNRRNRWFAANAIEK